MKLFSLHRLAIHTLVFPQARLANREAGCCARNLVTFQYWISFKNLGKLNANLAQGSELAKLYGDRKQSRRKQAELRQRTESKKMAALSRKGKGSSIQTGRLTNELEYRSELQAGKTELKQVKRKLLAGGRRNHGSRVWDIRNFFLMSQIFGTLEIRNQRLKNFSNFSFSGKLSVYAKIKRIKPFVGLYRNCNKSTDNYRRQIQQKIGLKLFLCPLFLKIQIHTYTCSIS